MNLELQRGEECEACGCAEHEVVQRRERMGILYEWLACTHCGQHKTRKVVDHEVTTERLVAPDPNGAVPYLKNRCPRCNSRNGYVYSTKLPVRLHLCRACGYRFRTYQE